MTRCVADEVTVEGSETARWRRAWRAFEGPFDLEQAKRDASAYL